MKTRGIPTRLIRTSRREPPTGPPAEPPPISSWLVLHRHPTFEPVRLGHRQVSPLP